MKYKVKYSSVIVLALLMIQVMLFTGCGSNDAIVDRSTITISPATVSIQNIISDAVQNYSVVVRYPDGTPIPFAKIHVSGAFAEPALGAAYQFYFYPDGTQNPNGNVTVDSGFDAETDKFGVYTFSIVVFGPGATFHDAINITSGTTAGLSTIDLVTTGA